MNMAGMIAKYFATSLAIEKVVSTPRVMSICLPISTTSKSLVGLESRSTMLPASLAACVPVFIATPTSACASAGASLVPSPVIATSFPLACSSLMSRIFASGVASREEIVNAGFPGDRRRRARIVAGDHHRANAHRAEALKAFTDAALHHVLQMDHAENFVSLGDHQRRAAGVGDSMRNALDLRAHRPTHFLNVGGDRIDGAFADLPSIKIAAAHPGLSAERE